MNPETAAAHSLLSAEAVRARAHHMLALGLADRLPNFQVDLSQLDATAARVIAITRQAYPSLAIPFHSRWRHFVVDGVVKRTWSAMIDRLKLPQNILLTIWASSAASWAGPIQSDTAPTTADYDWIKVYDWVPDPA